VDPSDAIPRLLKRKENSSRDPHRRLEVLLRCRMIKMAEDGGVETGSPVFCKDEPEDRPVARPFSAGVRRGRRRSWPGGGGVAPPPFPVRFLPPLAPSPGFPREIFGRDADEKGGAGWIVPRAPKTTSRPLPQDNIPFPWLRNINLIPFRQEACIFMSWAGKFLTFSIPPGGTTAVKLVEPPYWPATALRFPVPCRGATAVKLLRQFNVPVKFPASRTTLAA